MSRYGITVTAQAKNGNKIFTMGDRMDDQSNDSCGVMFYTGEKEREYYRGLSLKHKFWCGCMIALYSEPSQVSPPAVMLATTRPLQRSSTW